MHFYAALFLCLLENNDTLVDARCGDLVNGDTSCLAYFAAMENKQFFPQQHALVYAGKICPYCGAATELIHTGYGKKFICKPCDAWVGVHQGTENALGSLANAELRNLRMLAHQWFDPIAREGLIEDFYKVHIAGMSSRKKAYHWLSAEMNIHADYCHIAMFNDEECRRVVAICQPIVERLDGSGDIW